MREKRTRCSALIVLLLFASLSPGCSQECSCPSGPGEVQQYDVMYKAYVAGGMPISLGGINYIDTSGHYQWIGDYPDYNWDYTFDEQVPSGTELFVSAGSWGYGGTLTVEIWVDGSVYRSSEVDTGNQALVFTTLP